MSSDYEEYDDSGYDEMDMVETGMSLYNAIFYVKIGVVIIFVALMAYTVYKIATGQLTIGDVFKYIFVSIFQVFWYVLKSMGLWFLSLFGIKL